MDFLCYGLDNIAIDSAFAGATILVFLFACRSKEHFNMAMSALQLFLLFMEHIAGIRVPHRVLVLLVLRLCLFNLGTNHCFPRGEPGATELRRVMKKTEEIEITY